MAKTPEIDNRKNLRNILINGEMRFAQRGTSFASVANGAYTLDRYVNIKNTSAVHTISRDTDVPTFAQSGYVFQNSLRMNLTTPDDTIAAGDVHYIEQRVEGVNFVDIAQKPFTLSFWVKATKTGVYTVAFRNSGFDRAYVAEYTINVTNTWEYKTINVLASPSAGTWDYSTGVGLRVAWVLASGSTNNTTPGAWQTGNLIGTSSLVNGVSTGSTDFRITGAMLNEGSTALPFRLAAENYLSELVLCQRYFEKSVALDVALNSVTGQVSMFPNVGTYATTSAAHPFTYFRATKRVIPTPYMWDAQGNGGIFPASARYTYLQAGGAGTHNQAPGDIFISTNHIGLQVGGISGHAGVTYGWAAEAEL